jgi:hypothetical protein
MQPHAVAAAGGSGWGVSRTAVKRRFEWWWLERDWSSIKRDTRIFVIFCLKMVVKLCDIFEF